MEDVRDFSRIPEKELPPCPVETTLMLISDRWKVLILRDLMAGTRRFGALKNSIGHVTQKVLTANLREMEAQGLLTRKVTRGRPRGIHADRARVQSEAGPRRHAALGRAVQGGQKAVISFGRAAIRGPSFLTVFHAQNPPDCGWESGAGTLK